MALKGGAFSDLSRATWRNALATAHTARLLAVDSDEGLDPEQVFLSGLFHNVGDAVLLQAADRLRRQGNPIDPELVLRLSSSLHEGLGGAIAGKWGLGPSVVAVASGHHGPSTRPLDRATKACLDVVRTAHHLACGWVGPGLHPPSPPPATTEELRRLDDQLRETVLALLS